MTATPPRSVPAAAALALLLCAGCGTGLLGHDVTVTIPFTAGGQPPVAANGSINGTQLSQQLAASAGDLSKLSKLTLSSATLASTDGMDLSWVTGGAITITGNGLPQLQLASLGQQGRVGTAPLTLPSPAPDLRGYLASGSVLTAAFTDQAPPIPARGLSLTLVLHAEL